MFHEHKTRLPKWFIRPKPDNEPLQKCLFEVSLKDILARLKVSADDISKWHSHGWISITGSEDIFVNEFDDPRVFEIEFVRDIVRSGLSDAQMRYILDILPKPFTFGPRKIAFSFKYGWVEVSPSEDPIFDFEKELELELEENGPERLQELLDHITELLQDYEEEEKR